MVKSWPLRALRRLATVVVRLGPVSQRLARVMSGIALRYPASRGADRRIGTRAGDIPLRAAAAHRPAFMRCCGRGGSSWSPPDRPVLPAEVAGHVEVVTRADGGGETALVRPDGYLGWIGTDPGALTAFVAWPHGTRAAPVCRIRR